MVAMKVGWILQSLCDKAFIKLATFLLLTLAAIVIDTSGGINKVL